MFLLVMFKLLSYCYWHFDHLRKDMTELKFLWGVRTSDNSRKFIFSPACRLYTIGPTEKNVFSADVDL